MQAADQAEQLLDETKNLLESTLFALEAELRHNSQYFSESEKADAEKAVSDVQLWREENEFERVPIEDYQSRLDGLRLIVDPIRERRLKLNALFEKVEATRQKLSAIEKALLDDQTNSKDPEWQEVQNTIAAANEVITSFLGRPKYDDSPFDFDSLAKSVDEAAAKQTSVKAKPITSDDDRRRPGVIRNRLFGCPAADDWEDWPPAARWTRPNENKLRSRLEMEDDRDDDPWGGWFGPPMRRQRYPQRDSRAGRQAEVEREAEARRRDEERQRRGACWGSPWGDEQADLRRRTQEQAEIARRRQEQAEIARRKQEQADIARKKQFEEDQRKWQSDPWGRSTGWGGRTGWNDPFF
jgi:hypothetical protein